SFGPRFIIAFRSMDRHSSTSAAGRSTSRAMGAYSGDEWPSTAPAVLYSAGTKEHSSSARRTEENLRQEAVGHEAVLKISPSVAAMSPMTTMGLVINGVVSIGGG